MTPEEKSLLQSLPSIGRLLTLAGGQEWSARYSEPRLADALRLAVERARADILADRASQPPTEESLLAGARNSLEAASRLTLRPVINATGIILHTGLGRAPLSRPAVDALLGIASGYSNVELNLDTGQRGSRHDLVTPLLVELTGAEDAAVVNNNAAATLLVLNELSEGKQAVVSRGEQIEIGGSFRMPEIMAKSGAIMCEVGTTNRTRLADYEQAINPNTGVLVQVHTSNYRVEGFVESPNLAELVKLGRDHGVPVYHDLGSGALSDLSEWGLPHEPAAPASIQAGADVVTFSGDKLLGGPQCGIIVGRRDVISRLKMNPLMRTFRLDKLILAALEATLRVHLDRERARERIPVQAMLTDSAEVVSRRAAAIRDRLANALPGEHFELREGQTFAGGGSLPTVRIPTTAVGWIPASGSVDEAAASLRNADPPIIVRIQDGALLLDARTVRDEEIGPLVAALAGTMRPCDSGTGGETNS